MSRWRCSKCGHFQEAFVCSCCGSLFLCDIWPKQDNSQEKIEHLIQQNHDLRILLKEATELIYKMKCCCNCHNGMEDIPDCGDCDDTFKNWKKRN